MPFSNVNCFILSIGFAVVLNVKSKKKAVVINNFSFFMGNII